MGKAVMRTTFSVMKMDCPSEEQMIRMKLEGMGNLHSLRFDIPQRRLEVYHSEGYEAFLEALDTLDLDTRFVSSRQADITGEERHREERRILRQVLAINFLFFVLEILTGFIAGSMGLVADSLDMLADGIVYGLSLFAVGGSALRKKKITGIAGYFQFALAILGFAEVLRRFLGHGETPGFRTMIIVSLFALTGNAVCLYLLQKSKNREAHMQASMIFTSTDVIANLGVIAAGVLVYLTVSKIPDLLVGTVVFILVARGARRILRLSG